MGHPKLKKKSKRLLGRTKYKVEKKVREHNRKKRREAKKSNRKGPKHDLIIVPNLCPFKEQIVQEMNDAKVKEKEQLQINKLITRNIIQINDAKSKENVSNSRIETENSQMNKEEMKKSESISNEMEVENYTRDSLVQLMENAQKKSQGFSTTEEDDMVASRLKMESVTLAREFKKVVASADVILEVVDARDPLGTRCKIVEETVLQFPEKRLVIVVNKADLVPRDVLANWLQYLRKSWPAVPFKASVQQQARKLGRRAMMKKSNKKLEKLMGISACVGAEFLMRLLANYRRNKGIMTSITVGVVGVPNVGKSSVINSLKRSKSCKVGPEPGVTRTLQTVQVSKQVKILDSPGIVMADPILKNNTVLCLKNLVRSDRLHDPIQAAQAILVRATKEQMKNLYNVSDYSTTEEFLYAFSKRFGLLGKKGVPDTFKAARILVQDWNRGKIRFYTLPPEDNYDHCISAELINQVKNEFQLEALEEEEKKELEIKTIDKNKVDLLQKFDDSNKFVTYVSILDDKNTDEKTLKQLENVRTKKNGKLRWRKKSKLEEKESDKFAPEPKVKKLQKLAAKKKRKEEARKLARSVGDTMDVDKPCF